jgi:hypothetical protein
MLGKQERIAGLVERHSLLKRVIEERAVWYQGHPIGSSGLYIGRYEIVGRKEFPLLVEVFSLDSGTLRALRMIEKQLSSRLRKNPFKGSEWHLLTLASC